MSDLLLIPEAARELRCSASTIKRMFNDGTLTRVKVRRRTKVRADEVEAVKVGKTAQATAQKPADNVIPLRPEPWSGSFRERAQTIKGAKS